MSACMSRANGIDSERHCCSTVCSEPAGDCDDDDDDDDGNDNER